MMLNLILTTRLKHFLRSYCDGIIDRTTSGPTSDHQSFCSFNTVTVEETTAVGRPISSTVQAGDTAQNDTTVQGSTTVLPSPETTDTIATISPRTADNLHEGVGTTGGRVVAAIAAMIGIQIAAAVAAVEAVRKG